MNLRQTGSESVDEIAKDEESANRKKIPVEEALYAAVKTTDSKVDEIAVVNASFAVVDTICDDKSYETDAVFGNTDAEKLRSNG